jgi:glycosyltransferase involved in cell wall biosynthesis
LRKVWFHARDGYTLHGHVNAEYLRGLLLALAAASIAKLCGARYVLTFHAGTDQPYFKGVMRYVTAPLFQLLFMLSAAVICNSETVRARLSAYTAVAKVHPVAAFSVQYLDYSPTTLAPALAEFVRQRSPLLSTYLCFRDGFFTDTVLGALERMVMRWPQLGLVIVGTGAGMATFQEELRRRSLTESVFLAGDLDHDRFMTLVSQSALHLRTPLTDGVSSTVLEALALRIPVVAADNGNRPPSVSTYRADDAEDLSDKVDWVLRNRVHVVAGIDRPQVADTAAQEIDLITGINLSPLTEAAPIRPVIGADVEGGR